MVTLIALVEMGFILIAILVTLGIVSWKQKKNNHTGFEQVLSQISEEEGQRKKVILEYLTTRQHMETQQALELSEDFVEAEKQFFYAFLEQQMKKAPLTGFYQNVTGLLDKYLELLPEASNVHKVDESADSEQLPEEDSQKTGSEQGDTEADDKGAEEVTVESDGSEPNWDEAFAESGDEMTETVSQQGDSENVEDNQEDK